MKTKDATFFAKLFEKFLRPFATDKNQRASSRNSKKVCRSFGAEPQGQGGPESYVLSHAIRKFLTPLFIFEHPAAKSWSLRLATTHRKSVRPSNSQVAFSLEGEACRQICRRLWQAIVQSGLPRHVGAGVPQVVLQAGSQVNIRRPRNGHSRQEDVEIFSREFKKQWLTARVQVLVRMT